MVSAERIKEIEKHARRAARIAYRELFEAKILLNQVHEPLSLEDWQKYPKGLDGSLLDLIEGSEYMNLLCKQVGEDYDKMHDTCELSDRPGYLVSGEDDEYCYFNDAWRDVEQDILTFAAQVLDAKDE